MAPEKHTKMRISGFSKDYKFLDYLNSSLKPPNPKLDYFNFANKFYGTERATNNYYLDLLDKLSKNQSNKLMKIATNAKKLFNVFNSNEEEEREEEERGDDEGTSIALQQLSDLASNKVGHLKIIDLSSPIAMEILKSEIPAKKFNRITAATNIESITLSNYATHMLNALKSSSLSPSLLREALYTNGFKRGFNFILHFDVSFIEVTTRYFLDLLCSPNNPLNQTILERSAATYFIIYIVNQLFMSDNDIVQLDWLEREFFAIDKTKWDGVLIKVGNRSCSPSLIEFSGGCNDKTPSSKNQHDITKLYSKMVKILKKHPSNTTEQVFCLRYYACYKNSLFRSIHASIETPTTPRKLVEYIKEVPKILA
ncbi:uncharacterized protein BX663DRAFT_547883 [Cokeromyces recurvatus]|uniref:uncharacterized protein n=1 Tax=Cokeromyces recurvatus TaxID=90255 RepID=UPI00221EECBC|nr:uncharacterized protein BX663DRAFT_547883 [Cokeromyces recurvatus]KAI7908276.1 hypothetical protein BX663DRAFT_547883 [Cokeromyces recurvatus]